MTGENGRFIRKKVNYSMVSNVILRDPTISLRAKGLYSLIQSYITMDNFTLFKSFLERNCIEGERAFDSAWKELKEKGYLKQYKSRSGKGFVYEYELLDVPEVEEKQEVKEEKEKEVKQPITKEGKLLENLKKQITYSGFSREDLEQVDEILLLMSEILLSNAKSIKINQEEVKINDVKSRFAKLNYEHIQYVLDLINDSSGEIKFKRSYLITILYNAPTTMALYYTNCVNRHLYGERKGII